MADGLIGDEGLGLRLTDGLIGDDRFRLRLGVGLDDRLVGVDWLGSGDGFVGVDGLGLCMEGWMGR